LAGTNVPQVNIPTALTLLQLHTVQRLTSMNSLDEITSSDEAPQH